MKISKNILKAYIQDTQQMLEGWRYNMQTYAAKPKANQAVIDIASKRAATVKRLIEAVQTYLRGNAESMIDGTQMPQGRSLEEAILGACMLDSTAINKVSFLTQDDFYVEANQLIWQAMLMLKNKNQPIEMITVVEQLRANNFATPQTYTNYELRMSRAETHLQFIGGAYYVTDLIQRVASAANIEYHARILQQYTFRRKSIFLSDKIRKMAFDHSVDVFEIEETLKKETKAIFPQKKQGVNV